jgi:hypothetical protein
MRPATRHAHPSELCATTSHCTHTTAYTQNMHRAPRRPLRAPRSAYRNDALSHTRPPLHTHVRAVRLPSAVGILSERWLRSSLKCLSVITRKPHRTSQLIAKIKSNRAAITNATNIQGSSKHATVPNRSRRVRSYGAVPHRRRHDATRASSAALTSELPGCLASTGCCRRVDCCSSQSACRTHKQPSHPTTAIASQPCQQTPKPNTTTQSMSMLGENHTGTNKHNHSELTLSHAHRHREARKLHQRDARQTSTTHCKT